MVKKLQKVAKALGKASKLHKKQSNIIKKHIKEIIRQFEVKYSNIGKEAIILSSNYYS